MQGVILAVIEHPEMAGRVAYRGAAPRRAHGRRPNRGAGDSRTPPDAAILPSEEVLTRKHELQIREREQARITALKAAFDAWCRRHRNRGFRRMGRR